MTQDLERARDSLRADIQETMALLAPARFEPSGLGRREVLGDCPRNDGTWGMSYSFKGWKAEGPFQGPREKADRVARLWEGKGYTVKKRYTEGVDFEVLAASVEDNTLIFGIGAHGQAMTLHGETVCLPTGEDASTGA